MPRHSMVLQVFIASPSDVSEERAILDTVVAELNQTWSRNLNLTFEILKWENSTRPGFDKDPQAVINSQIGDDYDVFLGILWSRLGTPTGRATSGTVEEFERAYARFQSTGSPEVMLYFKDAPISPSKLDAAQLGSLLEFKTSIASRGGLYSTFEDQAGFEASVRAHLSAIAQKFGANRSSPVILESNVEVTHPEPAGIDNADFGLLDYLDIYESRTQDMTLAMASITEATARIGEQLAQRTAELPDAKGNPQAAMKFIKRAADDMFHYADTMGSQVPVLSNARQDAFSALSSAFALMADFPGDVEQLRDLRTTLYVTIESATAARAGLIGMRDATSALPRISKDLNKAKHAVGENLNRFLAEIESTVSTVENLIEVMTRLLDSATSGGPASLASLP